MRIISKLLFTFIFLLLAGCAGNLPTPDLEVAPGTDYSPRTLYDLGGLDTLTSQFNQDEGSARLLVLLSPT